MSWDPKVQLSISNIDIVTRVSNESTNTTESLISTESRTSPGRRMWTFKANVARLLIISVKHLVVKTPKATAEVTDLRIDISKVGGTTPSILVHLKPVLVVVHMGEPRISFEPSSSFNNGESVTTIEQGFVSFTCKEFHLSCEFGHVREAGIVVKNVNMSIGEVVLKLNEELIPHKMSSDTPVFQASTEYNISEYTSFIPEKVCLTLSKLNVSFVHKEQCNVMENYILDIQLERLVSWFPDNSGESTLLDLQLERLVSWFTTGPACFKEFRISCVFDNDRETGIVAKKVDISVEEITLNLNEELIPRTKSSNTQVLESSTANNIAKYTSFIPEKFCLTLPKLNVRLVHKEHYISMANNIIGIKLECTKSRLLEDSREIMRLGFQLDFSEIYLLKEAEDSMVDILNLAVTSSVYIPLQDAVESVSVGNFRFSLQHFLVKLMPWNSKLQLLINDIAIFTRNSMWMVVANMTPQATVEVKDFEIEISKDGGTTPYTYVKLQLLNAVIHLGDPHISLDRASSFKRFNLSCAFDHDREAGIVVKNVDISIGELDLNLNEELIPHKKSYDTQDLQSRTEYNIAKYTPFIPEKVSVSLPKLNVRFEHYDHCIAMENNIKGIQLTCAKYPFLDDIGENTRLDLHLDFSEIHLLKEVEDSMVEISELAINSSVYIPLQHASPIRFEMNVNLGGTKCNLFMGRLKPLMKMVLRDDNNNPDTVQSSSSKAILWKCTGSVPGMKIGIFDVTGVKIYHGCLQSSHVSANNTYEVTAVHLELGELNLHMADEDQESLRESLTGVETTGSLLHIPKISLDWRKKDNESPQDDSSDFILVLFVTITSMEMNLTSGSVLSLLSTAFFFKMLLKTSSPSIKAQTRVRQSSGKRIHLIKFNLQHCSVNLVSVAVLENEVIEDPILKQDGSVLFNALADETPRTAIMQSTVSNEHKTVKTIVTLNFCHFRVCLNKTKQTIQLELKRAKFKYLENNRCGMDCKDCKTGKKVKLFDLQNAKFVREVGGHKEIVDCTNITVRWEPDVHLALLDLGLRMKLLYDNQRDICGGSPDKDNELKEESMEPLPSENKIKKESLFAIQLKMVTVTAEAGDGVEALIHFQSISSENAHVSVFFEGLMISFNKVRVLKSWKMKISRKPNVSSESDGKWDWSIEPYDIHICMPYRLQLLAIHESIQEMLRTLKLITASKSKLICPLKESDEQSKLPSSLKIGHVKFYSRKLTVDIEEEPMQGWLDDHYLLWKNEARELAVRLAFLDSITKRGRKATAVSDEEIALPDTSSVEKLKEEIYKQSFHSYYRACQDIVAAEGSGPIQNRLQSGFKFSTSRAFLFSITATELNLIVTSIEGGEAGMIDFIRKLDSVALENKVPFSCLYGCNLNLKTDSLVLQLRNYTYPLFDGTVGKCEGRLVLAQQGTNLQPQELHDVWIGRWRKVQMYRSVSGTTPPLKTYWDLPLFFDTGEISYGVGFAPALADLSYAFTVALGTANLSVRNPNASKKSSEINIKPTQKAAINDEPTKKEESLQWWDEMRNSIHGKTKLCFSESTFNILATADPYEKSDILKITSKNMKFKHSDGRIYVSAKDLKMFSSSLEVFLRNSTMKPPAGTCGAFLLAPSFKLEVTMVWECESGNPLNHFLFALPSEGVTREKIYDPFRSTCLSLRWNFSLRPIPSHSQSSRNDSTSSPTLNVGPHDFAWLVKFINLNYTPPHQVRSFSLVHRFGVKRVPKSLNLSLEKVMSEFMLRFESTATVLRHMSLDDSDPAKGFTFKTKNLEFEMCYSRGKQKYTSESKRDILDCVYEGLEFTMPNIYLNKNDCTSVIEVVPRNGVNNTGNARGTRARRHDDRFLLSCDSLVVRRQSPNTDITRLLAWQKACRENLEKRYYKSEIENGNESNKQERSDPNEDDNIRRIFVYGLKLLWMIENRDAMLSLVGQLSKAFTPSKPSPSRQDAQKENKTKFPPVSKQNDSPVSDMSLSNSTEVESESLQENVSKNPSIAQGASSSKQKEASGSELSLSYSPEAESEYFHENVSKNSHISQGAGSSKQSEASRSDLSLSNFTDAESESLQENVLKNLSIAQCASSSKQNEASGSDLSLPNSGEAESESLQEIVSKNPPIAQDADFFKQTEAFDNPGGDDSDDEETHLFLINFIEPQFNFHSEDAKGMFLLAAGSGRILARSYHKALKSPTSDVNQPKVEWSRRELSLMLEQAQAHVAPTDVDPGAGLQWLSEIHNESRRVRRSGTLLERVFIPSDMYLRYTFHKAGTDLKVKPLKELAFNSNNITATMTSHQFEVMFNVLTNLLFSELPKFRRSSLPKSAEDDEEIEDEADELVHGGDEEIKLRINLEKKERKRNLVLGDIQKLSVFTDTPRDAYLEQEGNLWMLTGGRATLVHKLTKRLVSKQKSRKMAAASLRTALQKAAQLRLMEKEKNKIPSCAMRISLQINKVPLEMLVDEESFAEVEINEMKYDFDRDYKDVGLVRFTTKYFVVRNCMPKAKFDMVLSAWNPPTEWEESVMLRVDAKQGAPKDGNSPIESFQVEIYPLKIYWTRIMYRKMREYFFPKEQKDIQLPQEVFRVSSTTSLTRAKRGFTVNKPSISGIRSRKKLNAERRLRVRPTRKPRVIREIHYIKISQVELLVTYEGSSFSVNNIRLLMDAFRLHKFTGTWKSLVSRVKIHIVWGVLKSLTGMQAKKFRDKILAKRKKTSVPSINASEVLIEWPPRPREGAGDDFVTSIRELFHFHLRTTN